MSKAVTRLCPACKQTKTFRSDCITCGCGGTNPKILQSGNTAPELNRYCSHCTRPNNTQFQKCETCRAVCRAYWQTNGGKVVHRAAQSAYWRRQQFAKDPMAYMHRQIGKYTRQIQGITIG